MERKRFEKLVQDAIAGLPDEFLDRLQNVAIIVEDNPSAEMREAMDISDDEVLFGLFEGVPLTERGAEAPLHPDRIWIFQKPIEEECEDEEEIKDEIRTTIIHEAAHFFGIDDEYLEDLGY